MKKAILSLPRGFSGFESSIPDHPGEKVMHSRFPGKDFAFPTFPEYLGGKITIPNFPGKIGSIPGIPEIPGAPIPPPVLTARLSQTN